MPIQHSNEPGWIDNNAYDTHIAIRLAMVVNLDAEMVV